jgi:drug/metabolite transporter (DMT)-like permease
MRGVPDGHTGEIASLGVACCWMVSALSFEAAGRRIGTLSLNLLRLLVAAVLLTAWGAFWRGSPLPTDASTSAWLWLAASAVIGFVFGDLCLFKAFVVLGPRLSSLIMVATPLWTALFGLVFLGEMLSLTDVCGMLLTVGGIGLAVADRKPSSGGRRAPPTPTARGVALALCGSLGQAGGLILSKHGMGDYDPFAATQIRVLAGIVGFLVVITAVRWWPKVIAAVKDRPAMGFTGLGAVFGPFLGVSLSLLAVQHTHAGVAASIMAVTPILLIPAVMIRGERVGALGIVGTLIAVGGVVMLFMFG